MFIRFVATLFFALGFLSVQAGDWPQWRGPARTGHVPKGEAVPATLPETIPVRWRLKTGEGLSSPVVSAGRVFLFEAKDGFESLSALHVDSGSNLWSSVIDKVFGDSQGPSGPRCTPLVDGGSVYAQSCRGELQCLSVKDGSLIWKLNYSTNFGSGFFGENGAAAGATRHGNTASPLIHGKFLYALAGSTNGAGVVCLDKKSGTLIWKSVSEKAAYSPPIMATVAGSDQLVCYMAESVQGLDPKTGAVLWRFPIKTALARHVTTPIVIGDIVIVGSHQFGEVGIKLSREGTAWKAEQAWLNKETAMNFSSPVVVGEHFYGVGPQRNLICVEGQTGKIAWSKEGIFTTSPDKTHGAFLVLNDRVLTLTDSGELVLFAADPTQVRELSRTQVCGLNWCNPAYSNGRLYVRDGTKKTGELLCLELLKK